MLVMTVVVLAAGMGIAGSLLLQHSHASQTPTAQPASPSRQTAQPAPPSSGVVPSATAAPSAEVPGLAPFVGIWHAHEEGLDIAPNGHGRETYNDRSTCPDAPMSGCGIAGTTDFMLTSVSGDTATGTITAASNPRNPMGGPVTIKLVGGAQGLQLSVAGGDQGFPFCNSNDNNDASHYYCGA